MSPHHNWQCPLESYIPDYSKGGGLPLDDFDEGGERIALGSMAHLLMGETSPGGPIGYPNVMHCPPTRTRGSGTGYLGYCPLRSVRSTMCGQPLLPCRGCMDYSILHPLMGVIRRGLQILLARYDYHYVKGAG